MSLLEDVDLELVLFIARCLWLRHNSVVFGDSLTPPLQFVQQCTEAFNEFRLAEAVPGSISPQDNLPPQSLPLWHKLTLGTLKTNWDVQRNCMGVGVIIRMPLVLL
ncbi:hypothetical protein SLA2020_269190 [Shorea laevis]